MIRTIFPFALFIQGLIHLLGFVKEWELAQVKQLTGETLHTISLLDGLSKIIGILWLIAVYFSFFLRWHICFVEKRIVTAEMIDELPPVVQRWLKRSNIVGKKPFRSHIRNREVKWKPDLRAAGCPWTQNNIPSQIITAQLRRITRNSKVSGCR